VDSINTTATLADAGQFSQIPIGTTSSSTTSTGIVNGAIGGIGDPAFFSAPGQTNELATFSAPGQTNELATFSAPGQINQLATNGAIGGINNPTLTNIID
jgi:hypothetical protein